jgi:hypothetical protein
MASYCQGGLTAHQKKDMGNNESSETTTPSDRGRGSGRGRGMGRGRGRVDLANNEPRILENHPSKWNYVIFILILPLLLNICI